VTTLEKAATQNQHVREFSVDSAVEFFANFHQTWQKKQVKNLQCLLQSKSSKYYKMRC